MAYNSTANPPFAMTPPPVAGGFTVGSSDMWGTLWGYRTTDPVATVRGGGYFTDGQKRGMRRGDPIFVFDTNVPNFSLNYVSSVSSTGVTITSGTT